MKLSLDFQKIECSKCGGVRILASPCPECGARAPKGEVNRFVVSRREGLRLVDAAISKLEAHGKERDEPTPDDLIACLSRILEAIPTFVRAPTSDENVTELAGSIVQLQSMRGRLEAMAGLRPGIGMRVAKIESARRLERVWELYRTALSADTIVEAQTSASRAQDTMDSAGEPIQSAAELKALSDILGDDRTPIPERMFAALREQLPEVSVAEMPARGALEAEEDLGIPVGPSSGLSFLLLKSIAETLLDPVKYQEKIRLASSAVTDDSRIKSVAAMEGALSALSEAHRTMVEAAVAYNAVLAVEEDERAIARRTGRFAHEIYEAATPVFAWYRLIAGSQGDRNAFNQMSSKDATALAGDLQNGALAPVFQDAAKYLRHAPVHGRALDYRTETGEFVVSLKSHSEVIAAEIFLDRILALLETVLASTWSLENAIELANIEVSFTDADALYLGFTPLVLTAISLPAVSDMIVKDYGKLGDGWFFRVESDSDLLLPALVAAENAVGVVDWVELSARDEPPLTVRLADSKAWTKTSGHEMTTNFLVFKSTADRAGTSVLERTDVQYGLAGLGAALLRGDIQTVPHLRKLRALSRERGWLKEVRLADEIMAVLRNSASPTLGNRLADLIRNLPIPRMPAARAVRVDVSR